MLTVQNISKTFGENEVIKELSFSISKNDFVSIIGPSGSGKSTVFNLIGGRLTPDAGVIRINGKKSHGIRGVISYMPQAASLFPWRTVLENVILGQEIKGIKEIAKAKEMLEIAGLKGYENAYPNELSGGMKQRVSFIRAMLSPQELVCLDEPFSSLDELTRLEMQKWLLSIWEVHKRTVLFITHNIEEAILLSDRILVFSEKPTKVQCEIEVPFVRPRSEHLLLNEETLRLKQQIFHMLNRP